MRTTATMLALGAATAVLSWACPASAGQIVMKDGSSIDRIEVTDAGTDQVKFKQAGSTQSRPSSDVEIIFPTFDSTLARGINYLREGDTEKAIQYFQRVIGNRRKKEAQPFGQFFLAEAYAATGKSREAVQAYDECAAQYASHFCAPLSLERAAKMLSGSQALARYEKLASGKYGNTWKEVGQYGQAIGLLNSGKHDEARSIFSQLSRARDKSIQALANCARAHCDFLGGKKSDAERTFRSVSTDPQASGAAKGYAWTGLGLCKKGSDDGEALLCFLRGLLLYPSNPQRAIAGKEAGAIAKAKSLGGDRRLTHLGRAGVSLSDYQGKHPEAELMKRTLQQASAGIVQEFGPKLLTKIRDPEAQADLEFTMADAMKVVAKATKDTAMLTAYEKKLDELRKKYPNHGRASMAGINQIEAGKAKALAVLSQAAEAEEDAEREKLTNQARQILKDLIASCEGTIKTQDNKVKELLEKETSFKNQNEIPKELTRSRMRAENERDLTQFFMADAYTTLSNTYEEGSEDAKANLDRAKSAYATLVEGNDERAGTSNDYLRNFGYIGQVEAAVKLGDLEFAIGLGTDLTHIELWYDPSHVPDDYKPQVPKDLDHVKQICINAHILLVKALVKAGKGEEALEAALGIDKKPNGKGWRDHPLGLQLVFERSKAMAGAGQGERGAREIYKMLKEAQAAADKGDDAARRRFIDACKVLSEISDVTGGEVYSPEVQFYVGYGYFCRGKAELAVAGYKGVLVAARTKEERETWVPKAVREIGNRLFQQERYLEAALAYQTVFTEFPEHELAQNAVKYAISATKRAIEQFGETESDGALNQFYKKLTSSATEAAGPEFDAKQKVNDAIEKQKRGKWVEAAQTYLTVPATYTDDKTKKTKKISYYPNAIANAGYCYSQAYKKSKEEKYLKLARDNLQKATKAGAEYGDRESQALACYYLGELELKLRDDPAAAMRALQPFDGELSSTKRAVRARYLQAMAALDGGKSDAGSKAEGFFNKIKDRKSDDFFGTFAYHMASKLRSFGNAQYKANPSALEVPRKWRARAARYAKLYLESEKDWKNVRDVVLFYLGDVLFEGGDYGKAAEVYEYCLKNFQEPKIAGRTKKKELSELARFDGARLNRAFSLAKLGKGEEAITALEEVRNIAYLKTSDGKIVGRGVFKDRKLSDRTYDFRTPDGRTRKMKVWFTTLDAYGEEVKFFDARPARSDERFSVVKGGDPTANYQRSDILTLELVFKRDYYAVTALFEAMWAKWKATGDKNLLAKKGGVTAACNELRYVLKGMDAGVYAAICAQSQLEPLDFQIRQWGADVDYLKIKLEREDWRGVANDIDMMIKLKRLPKAPKAIQDEIMKLKEQAEARK